MDWSEFPLSEVMPGQEFGVPFVRHSRMLAGVVLENYESGESVEDIANNFELDPPDVAAILAYASQCMKTKSAG